MHIKNKICLLFLGFLLASPNLFARTYMRLAAIYMAEDTGGGDHSRLLLDLGGGYLTQQGWSLGFLYATEKNSLNGGHTLDRSSLGPTVGWASKKDTGFYILGTYFISSKMTDDMSGSGYQIDVGYKFVIDKVSFAPQLSKKQYNYDKQYGQSIAYSESRIDPYFVVWVDF